MALEAAVTGEPEERQGAAAIVAAAVALSADLDLERVQGAIVAQAVALLSPDAAALFVTGPQRPECSVGAAHGLPDSYVAKAKVTPRDARAASEHAAGGLWLTGPGDVTPRWVRRLLAAGHAKSAAILPLRHGSKTHGLLALLYRTPTLELGPEDLEAARALGAMAAGALANALRHRETEYGTAESTFLLQIAHLLGATFDLSAIATTVVDESADLTESDLAALYLYDPVGQELELLAIRGEPAGGLDARLRRLAFSSLTAMQAAASRGHVYSSEWPGEGGLLALIGRSCKVQTALTVPLRARGSLLGLLFLARRALRRYTLRESELGLKLGTLAALAIDNAHLYASLREQMQQLRAAQAQLIEAEKMVSLGRIVAGVAHALNNPLATVSGYAQLLTSADVPPDVREDLARIDRGARRAADIVRELLAFARQRPMLPTTVDVADLIAEVVAEQEAGLREAAVEVRVDVQRNLPAVRGDRPQLALMLRHLIDNARQAIADSGEDGRLTVSARRSEGVRIAISDDGPGIPPELLDKVFEPFLTTREVGEGMGLGLAVCYGIVRAHGGRIWAVNNPERGATVYVELPAGGTAQGSEGSAL